MIEIIIEKAIESDLAEILVLQKLAYIQEAEIYNNFNISPLTQTLESVLEDFKVQDFHKACVEGKIIGSVKTYQKNNVVRPLQGVLLISDIFRIFWVWN
jgi:hypothetical protein